MAWWPRVRHSVAATVTAWAPDVLALVLLVAAVALIHLAIPGPVPSGGDGGNWLALAAERFGDGVMSARVDYLPLYPVFLGLVEAVMVDRIDALVLSAIVAKATLVVATYVCTRPLGRLFALVATAMVATFGSLLEAYAWGGYTQILAMGLGLLGTFFVVGYLNTGVKSHIIWGIVFCVATLLTHAMVGALLGVALALAVLHHTYMIDPRQRQRTRHIRIGMSVAVPVLAGSAILYLVGSSSGFQPTVNPAGVSRWDAILAAVRDAPYPWAVITIAAAGVLVFRFWPEHVAVTIAVGSSWAVSALALFAVTGEPRSLLVAQVGLILLAVVGFGAVAETLRPGATGRRESNASGGSIRYGAWVTLGVALLAAVAAGGLDAYRESTAWFRVVDGPELASLDRLAEESPADALVLAARGHHGNPVGWWVEGYAERSTYTGIDVRFVAFPDEVDQAEVANDFFAGSMSSEESLATLESIGADYVVVDRRGPDYAWLDMPFARSLEVVDDSSYLVILEAP